MDARNSGPDWPRPPTARRVVMGVAVVTGLPNGPELSGWIKSDTRAPSQRCFRPILGLPPLGAPGLGDVIEEGSLAPALFVWRGKQTGIFLSKLKSSARCVPSFSEGSRSLCNSMTACLNGRSLTATGDLYFTDGRLPATMYVTHAKTSVIMAKPHSPKTQLSQWLSDTDAKRSPLCGLILTSLKCLMKPSPWCKEIHFERLARKNFGSIFLVKVQI